MQAKLQMLVEMIYPPRCLGCGEMVESDFGLCPACWRDTPFIGGLVCETCGVPLPGESDGYRIDCDDCMTHPRPWDAGRAALQYKDGARRLVLGLKHGDRTDIAHSAAVWMARAARPIVTPEMIVAPVPLHWTRLLRRRYNQSALLSEALARDLGLDHCPDLLQRVRRTPSLEGQSPVQRANTLRRAIRAHPGRRDRIEGREVLLVDDVMTTGATLAAAAQAAHAAGAARVCVITLARVAKDA